MIPESEKWSDASEWDSYFQHRLENEKNANDGLPVFHEQDFEETASRLKSDGIRRVWVPGCGLSLLPQVLAGFGFEVVASDISSIAIEFQSKGCFDINNISGYNAMLVTEGLKCCVHDLRQPFEEGGFDLVVNARAFQRFGEVDMELVAKTHYRSLRGREAIFSTLNCQGKQRELVECSLMKAGFFIPFYEIEKWYRSTLKETGIPYALVLGRPIIPQVDENGDKVEQWDDEDWRNSSYEILKEITAEYLVSKEKSHKRELLIFENTETKIANIIYNTG